MKKLLLIINEKAGNGRNGASAYRVMKHFSAHDYAVTVFPITDETSAAIKDYLTVHPFDTVVCIGGDGTLNHTVNDVLKLGMNPDIGYIPAGTTNDFSQNLHLPKNFMKASEIITGGVAQPYDIGVFNDRNFLYVASFGAFASVSYETDQAFKNVFGYAAYVLSAISIIPEELSTKCHVRFESESEVIEGDYLFGAICNSLSVAGMKLSVMTAEELHDGKFELILIKCPDNIQELAETARALLQGDFNNPYVELRRVSSLKIYPDRNTEWTLDGEYGGNPEEIRFSILPKAVRIFVPKEDA